MTREEMLERASHDFPYVSEANILKYVGKEKGEEILVKKCDGEKVVKNDQFHKKKVEKSTFF